MKKFISIILTISLSFALVSCAKAQTPDWQTSLDLGQKYLLDGNYEQAIVEFNKVIEIDTKNVDAHLGLAEAYTKLGDYDKAIDALEQGYSETEDERLSNRLNDVRYMASAQTEAVTTVEVTTIPKTTTTVPTTTTASTTTTLPTTTTMPTTTIEVTSPETYIDLQKDGLIKIIYVLDEEKWHIDHAEIDREALLPAESENDFKVLYLDTEVLTESEDYAISGDIITLYSSAFDRIDVIEYDGVHTVAAEFRTSETDELYRYSFNIHLDIERLQ